MILAGLCFIHEAIPLIWGFAALPIVFVTGQRSLRDNVWVCLAVLGPALVAVAAVVLFGRVAPEVAAQLRVDASLQGPTLFRYLSQGTFESVQEVAIVGIDKHVRQITLGVLLVGSHVWWCRSSLGRLWLARFARLDRATLIAIALPMTVSAVVVFATGVDWVRWFCSFTTSVLMIIAFAVLSTREDRVATPSITMSWPRLAAIGYLASLTPLDLVEPTLPIPAVGAVYRLLGV